MELTDANLETLGRYLQLTLSPDPTVRRPAEQFLEGVESNQNYGLLMLRLIDKKDVDPTIKIAGSIAFKNYVKRNWAEDMTTTNAISEEERQQIRTALVELMLHSPGPVQKQLSDAISIIGKQDFPNKWQGLIAQMVEKFATEDFHLINGVLQTAHSLFKRYRYEFKSEELWTEIAFVLKQFAPPLTDLFVATLHLRKVHENNPAALHVIYSSLLLICKVFHSLNAQDLPEFFEDNMQIWIPNLLTLLQEKVPSLNSDDDSEPGIVDKVREAAVECGGLYALKYSEEFLPYAPGFVTAAWGALTDAGPQTKYDSLVSAALSFLSNVAEKKHYRYLFEDPSILSQICEKVIIPNMEFRESDQELFEDNPEEYIRRDIEGSDVETRRRAACDLVKVLSVNFEEKIFQTFGQYIQVMLARANSDPDGSQWRCKDVVLFLVTSLAERGRTARTGVTASSSLFNIQGFFQENVLPDLHNMNPNFSPILKADSIKYVITFRSLLPKEQIIPLFPCLMHHLNSDSGVVATYAANCLEKTLFIIGPAPELLEMGPAILRALLQLLKKDGHNENDYAMKCVMRVLIVMQSSCLPVMGEALTHFSQTLVLVSKNPSRPNFNHYLFECISLSVKLVCKASPNAVESFEDVFFPIFQDILQQEVQEFMPYVFQLLSLLVEQRSILCAGSLQENSPYLALVSCLLAPPLWERMANVRALVRLLSCLIMSAHQFLIRDNKLNGMLGVFQKLIASKANDQEGFKLVQCMMQHIPEETMRPFLKQILSLMFQRLSSSKTTKYIRGLIVFLGFYCVRYGPNDLIENLDATQSFLFAMYCERILIPELQKVIGASEIKMAAVGYTKLLCECPHLYLKDGKYRALWSRIMEALIALFELPTDETVLEEDDQYVDVGDESSYQPTYCQLASARQDLPDLLKEIREPREYLSRSLANINNFAPGALQPLIEQLSADHRNALQLYMQKYDVRIS